MRSIVHNLDLLLKLAFVVAMLWVAWHYARLAGWF